MSKKVCVIGMGYIGLPTSALLANKGFLVHGVDIDKKIVETINKGEIHISEPQLEKFVSSAVKEKTLFASIKPSESDIFIIAVPTPFKSDNVPNIDYVLDAANSISSFLKDGDLVILESTCPVGTTETIEKLLSNNGVDTKNIYLAYCPERVLPGAILKELIENDRIVGGINKQSTSRAIDFYESFIDGDVLSTDAKTAEMTKLTENSFRDTNIAFANEISILCDKFGIDVWELILLANRHPRVSILNPGVGVGGHCIAVDPWFIVHNGGDDARLIKTSRETNIHKTEWVIQKIMREISLFENKHKKPPKVACMGLAFKPNVEDLRESPALFIVKELFIEGVNVLAVEPNIEGLEEFNIFEYNDAIEGADIVVFLVPHKEFEELRNLKGKNCLDFCGVLS